MSNYERYDSPVASDEEQQPESRGTSKRLLWGVPLACAGIAMFGMPQGSTSTSATNFLETDVCASMRSHGNYGTPKEDRADVPTPEAYASALESLDMEAVKNDMSSLLKDSKECWPADWGNYGPFMVRLAWHSSGTYRLSDGKGGVAGGRQRFEPERSWPDNTNLDKARALVYPLKEKYGDALSWGDLFALAGTTALRDSGAPVTRMCFGRQDESDGSKSDGLNIPCPEQGNCQEPWAATTVGLIYVNPEGPMGKPEPEGSVQEIRRTFTGMGHSDRHTVALIGGGHALGKGHGACPSGPGLAPKDAFEQGVPIWEGQCGSGKDKGKGINTVTAGFEGPWTSNPLQWDNQYFTDLVSKDWEVHKGPGGHWQWRIKGDEPGGLMRLTSDIALLHDEKYKALANEFATDMDSFNEAFDGAWDDLVTLGGQWSDSAKCDDGSTPKASGASLMRSDDAELAN